MARKSAILQPGAITTFSGEMFKFRDAAITVLPFFDGLVKSVDDRLGGMKIRFAQFQMNDGTTLALQFPGMGKD